jgi:tRNA pseudouridine 55 synthase
MASGLVLIDKPAGITSFDVVAKLRKILNTRKIGHAGTLDPMATGLMILGVNQGTKLLQFLIGMDKQYVATIRLGAATVSDDSQGEVVSSADASAITAAAIDAEIKKLTGEILQLPSSVSAKKIDGKRAYDLVREGKSVELKPKAVFISRFERTSEPVLVGEALDFDAVVDCASGTYVRALARDIGNALGVGGHLTSLRRTMIGEYRISEAFSLETGLVLTPLSESVLQFAPRFEISAQQAIDVRNGKPLKLDSEEMRLSLSCGSDLVAISELRDGLFRSQVVFASEQ